MVLHRSGEVRETLRVESAHAGFDATTVENSSLANAEGRAGGDLRALLVSLLDIPMCCGARCVG
jgi:hypothetical protein